MAQKGTKKGNNKKTTKPSSDRKLQGEEKASGKPTIDEKHPREMALRVKAEQTRTMGMHLTQIFALVLLIVGVILLIYVNLNVDAEELQENLDTGLDSDDGQEGVGESPDDSLEAGMTGDGPGDYHD